MLTVTIHLDDELRTQKEATGRTWKELLVAGLAAHGPEEGWRKLNEKKEVKP